MRIALLLAFGSSAAAQFGPQQVLSATAFDRPTDVYASDLDGDGDQDVLAALESSAGGSKIVWYENLGGGLLGLQQVVTAQASGVTSVVTADFDGDQDQDVLAANYASSAIAWYENLGGGQFGPPQIVSSQTLSPEEVYASDLDGDGDPDVLTAAGHITGFLVGWCENLGGGLFGPLQVITNQVLAPDDVHAADLDGDGDLDVLSASFGDDKIAWYENLGGGSFGPQRVITLIANGANAVYAADLDGDGDQDVLSASGMDSTVAWYENLGGGSFGARVPLTTSAKWAFDVYASDLDGDGDADVLSASRDDDKIAWYENVGGFFGPQQDITTLADGVLSVYAADLDGDGDEDVLSASNVDSKVAWYENLVGGCPPTSVYCTASATSIAGCQATITGIGSPILSNPLAFAVSSGRVPGGNVGICFFGKNGRAGFPFGTLGGKICVQPPVFRTKPKNSGGSKGNCDGVFNFTLQDLIDTSPIIVAGATINAEIWARDPANPDGFLLSNGLEFTVCP